VTKAAATRAGADADRIKAYLAGVDPKKRAALQRLRAQVKAAAPDAEEAIAWSMPAFRQGGVILCYAAWKDHCSIYPGGSIPALLAKELAGFSLDRGTIRFTPEKPLPAALVKKIVKARLAEIESKKAKRKSAAAKKIAAPKAAPKKAEADVDAFFASLKHPLKKDIAAARAILLSVDSKIAEGVKWNSISFTTADYFATVNLRSTDAVQFVFHRGAKSKDGARDMKIADPKGLMKWLSSDRCLVTLGKGPAIAANKAAFRAIVKAWIRQL
jgi:uncharacterized protein YdhG (YjbR/CyaY superfamily)